MRCYRLRATPVVGGAAGVKKKKTSRGSKGKKYRMTGNQMDVERRRSDRGDQGDRRERTRFQDPRSRACLPQLVASVV